MTEDKMIGRRFGKLVVVEFDPKSKSKTKYLCKCDCGNIVSKYGQYLNHNYYMSCGCGWTNGVKKRAGETYGEWTILGVHSKTRGGTIRYLCRCSCGKEKPVLSSHLTRGNTRSCGCKAKKGKQHKQWTGYMEISGQFWGQIRRSANGTKGRRVLEFSISKEYVWNIYIQQNRKCALSGVDLYFPERYCDTGTASLDRIDSSLGYVEGNVQWVHKDINFMKRDLDQAHFIRLCKKVAALNQ